MRYGPFHHLAKVTRRYLPSTSGTCAHQRMRPVRLDNLLHWLIDRTLNPFCFDDRPIRPGGHFLKIPRGLHGLALSEWTSQSRVSA